MNILIKQLSGPELSLKVTEHDTVLSVKLQLEQKWDVPVLQQRLVLRGKTLEDGKLLNDYKIADGHKIFLTIRKDQQLSEAQNNDAPREAHPVTPTSIFGTAAQALQRLVVGSPAKPDFWDRLYSILEKHFGKEDATRILQRYRQDYKTSISCLSLDQIERLATAGLEREQNSS